MEEESLFYDLREELFFPQSYQELLKINASEILVLKFLKKELESLHIKALKYNLSQKDFEELDQWNIHELKNYSFIITKRGLQYHHSV